MYKSSNPINMSKCRYWTGPPYRASTYVCSSCLRRRLRAYQGSRGEVVQAYLESTHYAD